jgi:hypothetical protein
MTDTTLAEAPARPRRTLTASPAMRARLGLVEAPLSRQWSRRRHPQTRRQKVTRRLSRSMVPYKNRITRLMENHGGRRGAD